MFAAAACSRGTFARWARLPARAPAPGRSRGSGGRRGSSARSTDRNAASPVKSSSDGTSVRGPWQRRHTPGIGRREPRACCPRRYFVIGSAGQRPYEACMALLKLLVPRLAYAVLFAVCASGCSREKAGEGQAPTATSAAPALAGPLAAGSPAPDVTFKLHTGETLKLAGLRGKPVVVYFYPKDDT